MLGFVIQRLMQAALVMLAMSALVFVGVYAIGNPIDVLISPDATQDIREATIRHYGLDQPLWRQYLAFLGRLVQGDLGRSFVLNIPVLDLVLSRLPATLELALAVERPAALIDLLARVGVIPPGSTAAAPLPTRSPPGPPASAGRRSVAPVVIEPVRDPAVAPIQ